MVCLKFNWYFCGILWIFLTSEILAESQKIILNANRTSKIWTGQSTSNCEENFNHCLPPFCLIFFKSSFKSIEIPAEVPGGIYSDLEAALIFSNPIFYGFNDIETKWVGRTSWQFSRNFDVSESFLKNERIMLVCEGLDTIGKIYINNKIVGKSKNMFVRYIFDIKINLKTGKNEIRIEFASPVNFAKEMYDKYAKNYPIVPSSLPPEFKGENHVNLIRKMQASFSWDWGPSYPQTGIWKDIYIEGFNKATIRDLMVFIEANTENPDESDKTEWTINFKIFLEAQENKIVRGKLVLNLEAERETITTIKNIKLSQNKSEEIIILKIKGDKVKLWWPNGYGEQNLYNLNVTFISDGISESSEKNIKIGFRTLKLEDTPIDKNNTSKGNLFFFRVNGIPIFAKGSNFIPTHILPERVTKENLEWLLKSAKQTHSNMMRVWGGGYYQSEDFYDLTDKYGILIWQDFMFACSMYPASNSFLKNVHSEIETQVKRLQYRPSIAVWATNNENELALKSDWYRTSANYTLYKEDYIKLYIGIVKNLTNKLDPTRDCLPSSPTNGKLTEKEGWISDNPASIYYGDYHSYNYFDDNWAWTSFPSPRFSSEYGYQSWPWIDSLKLVTNPETDWTWNSAMMNHRQRHPSGQGQILGEIRQHLPLPKDALEKSGFRKMIYLSQVNQAMSIKVESEYYRRQKGIEYETGEGRNMGALYWQLNDVWIGCSWSSIDYYGSWKLLHYYAKNFFHPLLITPFISREKEDVFVHFVSDSLKEIRGEVNVRLFHLDSLNPVANYSIQFQAKPLEALEIDRISLTNDTYLKNCQNEIFPCLLYFTMKGVPDNFLFMRYPNHAADIPNPNLKVTKLFSSLNGKIFSFELTTEQIALFVFLNFKDVSIKGSFSDNGFIMVERTKMVNFTVENQPISFNKFKVNFEVFSLYDFI